MRCSARNTFTFLLTLLLVAPSAVFAGDSGTATRSGQPVIRDVELAAGGVASGKVVDPQGQPVAGMSVALHMNDGVHQVTTDADGNFAVEGLHGGACLVHVGKMACSCRFWSNKTAPPNALKSFAVVYQDGVTVRGQAVEGYVPPQNQGFLSTFVGLNRNQLLALGLAAGTTVAVFAVIDDDNSKPDASN